MSGSPFTLRMREKRYICVWLLSSSSMETMSGGGSMTLNSRMVELGVMPMEFISLVKEYTFSVRRRILGSATKVPRPCLRTTRPSLSSSPMAWRTVERETSKVRQSSLSLGSSAPAVSVPAVILRFIMLTSWE